MNKILNFYNWNLLNESIINNDLKKIYLIPVSDRWSFSHVSHLVHSVSDNLFELLTPPGIFVDSINQDLPCYNYGNKDELYDLIKKDVISKDNVYNLPENLKNVNSKAEFHQKMEGCDFVPVTKFDQKEAEDLKFPVIAKPSEGSKGEGIVVFKSKEEMSAHKPKEDDVKFGVFSEKFDLKREFRVITVCGDMAYVAERIPTNEKAKSLREDANLFPSTDLFKVEGTLADRSSYEWVEMEDDKLTDKEWDQIKKICPIACEKLGLEVMGLDFGLDSSGKIFLIEANSCPGLNRTQIIIIYLAIFKDFYGRMPDEDTMKKIEEMQKALIDADDSEIKFSHSSTMGRKMDWTYAEDGRKTSTVKFDIEKQFGKPL